MDIRTTIVCMCSSAADIEFLGHIAGPVTAALRHGLARTFIPATDGGQIPAGPVVLLLSPALEVRAQTPQTRRYLQVLVPPQAEGQAPIPAGAYNVAAQLLAAEAGVDDNPPVARVHLAGGRWLTLRAARMDANPTTPAPAGRDVAVSIEPTTAGDRVTVFARACGLTPREAELLQHLAGGATTREVAQQMFVSENTVTAVVDRDLGFIAAGREGLAGGGSRRPNTLVTGGRRRRKAGAAAVIMPVCGKDKSGSR
jgi:hypothetical protein